MPARKDPEPLRPVVFAILVALNEESRHGYSIMKVVNERTKRRAVLGPGTLYRTLKELRDDELIEYAPAPPDADSRRRYYTITVKGRDAARAEAARMAGWVEAAREGRLLPSGGAE
jgi:DNA-binding PadR family transcriptional regulator